MAVDQALLQEQCARTLERADFTRGGSADHASSGNCAIALEQAYRKNFTVVREYHVGACELQQTKRDTVPI